MLIISILTFKEFGLDESLIEGIEASGYENATPVQEQVIPLILNGQDIIASAQTGTGKTAAFLLPIINKLLASRHDDQINALVIVPTRELAEQVYKAVEAFTAFCAKDIRAVNLTQKVSDAVQRSLLADSPDIVIATPARAVLNLNTTSLSLGELAHLVIDEADLVLSYGYDDDLQNVAKVMPKGVQTILMSATLTSEVETLKGLFCRNPAILKLEETEDEGEGVSQYVVK